MKYRCAVIGQPPMRFPWGFDEEDSRCCRMKLEMGLCKGKQLHDKRDDAARRAAKRDVERALKSG